MVNQHVEPTFHFSAAQFERMRTELLKRMQILTALAPWPDPNYAIDESWAAIDPYGTNHAPRAVTYRVTWNTPQGWQMLQADRGITIPARGEGAARARFVAEGEGQRLVTAEAMVRVRR